MTKTLIIIAIVVLIAYYCYTKNQTKPHEDIWNEPKRTIIFDSENEALIAYQQKEKQWKTQEQNYLQQIEKLKENRVSQNQLAQSKDEDLTTELDSLKREKGELESEVLALTNQLKNKQKEVGNKEKSLEALKKEFNQKEVNWQKQIKEKNGIITTLTKEINQLKRSE